jgi:hypothetical protein
LKTYNREREQENSEAGNNKSAGSCLHTRGKTIQPLFPGKFLYAASCISTRLKKFPPGYIKNEAGESFLSPACICINQSLMFFSSSVY